MSNLRKRKGLSQPVARVVLGVLVLAVLGLGCGLWTRNGPSMEPPNWVAVRVTGHTTGRLSGADYVDVGQVVVARGGPQVLEWSSYVDRGPAWYAWEVRSAGGVVDRLDGSPAAGTWQSDTRSAETADVHQFTQMRVGLDGLEPGQYVTLAFRLSGQRGETIEGGDQLYHLRALRLEALTEAAAIELGWTKPRRGDADRRPAVEIPLDSSSPRSGGQASVQVEGPHYVEWESHIDRGPAWYAWDLRETSTGSVMRLDGLAASGTWQSDLAPGQQPSAHEARKMRIAVSSLRPRDTVEIRFRASDRYGMEMSKTNQAVQIRDFQVRAIPSWELAAAGWRADPLRHLHQPFFLGVAQGSPADRGAVSINLVAPSTGRHAIGWQAMISPGAYWHCWQITRPNGDSVLRQDGSLAEGTWEVDAEYGRAPRAHALTPFRVDVQGLDVGERLSLRVATCGNSVPVTGDDQEIAVRDVWIAPVPSRAALSELTHPSAYAATFRSPVGSDAPLHGTDRIELMRTRTSVPGYHRLGWEAKVASGAVWYSWDVVGENGAVRRRADGRPAQGYWATDVSLGATARPHAFTPFAVELEHLDADQVISLRFVASDDRGNPVTGTGQLLSVRRSWLAPIGDNEVVRPLVDPRVLNTMPSEDIVDAAKTWSEFHLLTIDPKRPPHLLPRAGEHFAIGPTGFRERGSPAGSRTKWLAMIGAGPVFGIGTQVKMSLPAAIETLLSGVSVSNHGLPDASADDQLTVLRSLLAQEPPPDAVVVYGGVSSAIAGCFEMEWHGQECEPTRVANWILATWGRAHEESSAAGTKFAAVLEPLSESRTWSATNGPTGSVAAVYERIRAELAADSPSWLIDLSSFGHRLDFMDPEHVRPDQNEIIARRLSVLLKRLDAFRLE